MTVIVATNTTFVDALNINMGRQFKGTASNEYVAGVAAEQLVVLQKEIAMVWRQDMMSMSISMSIARKMGVVCVCLG